MLPPLLLSVLMAVLCTDIGPATPGAAAHQHHADTLHSKAQRSTAEAASEGQTSVKTRPRTQEGHTAGLPLGARKCEQSLLRLSGYRLARMARLTPTGLTMQMRSHAVCRAKAASEAAAGQDWQHSQGEEGGRRERAWEGAGTLLQCHNLYKPMQHQDQ